MKQTIVAAAAAVAFLGGSALAADLPVRAPYYKAPQGGYFNWIGPYAGVHAGWLRSDNSVTDIDGLQDAAGTRFDYSADTFVAGVHIGNNWQYGMFVLGGEADISGTSARSSVVQDNTPGSGFTRDGLARTKLSWLGSVRGRVGISPTSQWLVYGTAGLAFGQVRNETLDFDSGVFHAGDSSSKSGVRTGWVAGGGIEVALHHHWIGRVEYLHYDLGDTTTITPNSSRFSFSNEVDVVRIGVSRKFW
jgi:outer membrane immunogenic protein